MWVFLLLLTTLGHSAKVSVASTKGLQWEGIELEGFESPTVKNLYQSSGYYESKNMVATKAATRLDKVFFLTPRFRSGVPSSVVLYDTRQTSCSPMFRPYPDLASHELGNCNAVQNAVDFFLDSNGNLWVLDSGIVNTADDPECKCPPKVVCFSTTTNRIVRTINISKFIPKNVKLCQLVVDFDSRRKPYLYIGDSSSVLVYNVEAGSGYRVELPEEIQKNKGTTDIIYMALATKSSGKKCLFITFYSASNIYSINTQYLMQGKKDPKISVVGSKPAPLVFLGTDSQSKIYFRYHNDPEIFSWDVSNKFDGESLQIVYSSDGLLLPACVFPDGIWNLKVLDTNYRDFVKGEYGCGVFHKVSEIPREDPNSNEMRKSG